MTVTGDLSIFFAGALGGALTELLHWWNLRTSDNLPAYAKSVRYWLLTGFMVAVGGLMSWVQLGREAEAMVAVQIGVAAPLVLQKLVTSLPQAEGARGAIGASLRDFFRW